MKDSDFKSLPHRIGSHSISTRGAEVSQGYKPDITILNADGDLEYILECEQKTDRKAFIGNIIKAEVYSEQCTGNPTLIIIMQEFYNTTVSQIGNHLKHYYDWIYNLKNRNIRLKNIIIISDKNYLESVIAGEEIGSDKFNARAYVIAP